MNFPGQPIEYFFEFISWEDNYYDLYPGYSETPLESAEYYFDSEESAIKDIERIIDLFESLYEQDSKIILYRAIYSKNKESIDLEYPGESWSFNKEAALEFGVHSNSNFLLIGETHRDNIDWEKAIRLFLKYSGTEFGESEDELPIIDETKITILDIQSVNRGKIIGSVQEEPTEEWAKSLKHMREIQKVNRETWEETMKTRSRLKKTINLLAQEDNVLSKDEILAWFSENPNPSDDDVHEWAEENGIDPSAMENAIYGIVTDHVTMLEEMKGGYK